MAASGAVVVTNQCGIKTSLARYSENIVCVEPSVEGLKDGLSQGAAIVADENVRLVNYSHNNIVRDWPAKFLRHTQFLYAGTGRGIRRRSRAAPSLAAPVSG